MERVKSLTELTSVLTPLPRGGYLVNTSEGYIQFGSPPETLKDTKLLPESVPKVFILPDDHFHPTQGISMAEVEFPIYFNFFIRKQRTIVYVNSGYIENLKIVLSEAAFGPEEIDVTNEVEQVEGYYIPDIKKEISFFRGGNTLENMVDIRAKSPDGIVIGQVKIIERADKSFEVFDKGVFLTEVPKEMKFYVMHDLGAISKDPFVPPEFGITCLGPSHGFDHEQNTSGFIFWINKNGIMVDPPVNSTEWLKDSNVNPKFIDTLILTHCHADHDSGTFQKILEEEKINLYTTPTILKSFLRKYSALTRIPSADLLQLFTYNPVKLNTQFNIHGAIFTFFYTLHSIPTIGFMFSYRNKSFIYSSDHLNEPTIIKDMNAKGYIGDGRMQTLLDFPWYADMIYHEAGIPPLHTPISYLSSLPEDVKKRITVYHIAKKDFPADTGLKQATFGIGETVYPEIKQAKYEGAYRILDVFSRIEIFKELPREQLKDLLLIVEEEHFSKGDYIIHKNTVGHKFYVIVAGNVTIGGVENVSNKVYGTYEYFGESSLLLGTLRAADVIAESNVMAYSIEKESFLRLIRNTAIERNIRKVASMRNAEAWNAIRSNRYFKNLSTSQVTMLESIMSQHKLSRNSFLFSTKEDEDYIYILNEGTVMEYGSENSELLKGELLNFDFNGGSTNDLNYEAMTDATFYRIDKEDFKRFLKENPGVMMQLMFEHRK